MSDRGAKDELLDANAAFYAAFGAADVEAMVNLWAAAHPVTCTHPGWPVLHGRDAVLASWRGILSGDDAPAIECRRPTAEVAGELGYVVCYEALEGHLAAALNLFRREAGRWRLVHHQASVCAIDDAADANTTLQ